MLNGLGSLSNCRVVSGELPRDADVAELFPAPRVIREFKLVPVGELEGEDIADERDGDWEGEGQERLPRNTPRMRNTTATTK